MRRWTEPFLYVLGSLPGMGQGENGDGVLDPAVPAALLDAYWLMVDSPARSLCGRCRPEQAKDSAAVIQQRRVFNSERMSGRWGLARTVILAVAAGSVVAAVWVAAVAGG